MRYSKTFTHYARTRWRDTFWDVRCREIRSTKTRRTDFDQAAAEFRSVRLGLPRHGQLELSAFLATDQGDINGDGDVPFPQTGQTTSPPVIMPRGARYLYGMGNPSIKNELLTAMLGFAGGERSYSDSLPGVNVEASSAMPITTARRIWTRLLAGCCQ